MDIFAMRDRIADALLAAGLNVVLVGSQPASVITQPLAWLEIEGPDGERYEIDVEAV